MQLALKVRCLLHLHSTMYLLIPGLIPTIFSSVPLFTFHYVSINSTFTPLEDNELMIFTFHYVSINSY